MSNVLYPIGLFQKLDIERVERVIVDPFEDGGSASRNTWPAQSFKRKFTVAHAPLKADEYNFLRSFHSQRSGGYDSFWFRDNISRMGNAQVRFMTNLKESRATQIIGVQIDLGENAPIRALPEFDELAAAAGFTPVLWYDANREFYLQHCGAVILDPLVSTWDVMKNYRAAWQSGSTINIPAVATAQYQQYHFSGVEWAKTAANISQLAGTQPACTIFLIAKHSTTSTKQILFALGAKSSGAALGIQLSAANNYTPWIGGTETYAGAVQSNGTADTNRSLAVVWAASSNTVSLYANAALIGTDTNTRALTAGPASLGAAMDGTSICNPSNAMANAKVTHVLVFAGALTLAQIKAVHNLLGYQHGLATVA